MANAHASTIPLRTFKFKVYFAGNLVAQVSKMSALKRTTEVVEWRAADDNNTVRKLPGKTKYEPITFEQGLFVDDGFYNWANSVNHFDNQLAENDNDFRRDLRVEVLDLDDQVKLKYQIFSCWVSEFTALPDLDANGNTVGIRNLKIENEGWKKEE